MLARGWDVRALDRHDWSFEVKYDGVRAVVVIASGTPDPDVVNVYNRSNQNISFKYPELQQLGTGSKYETLILDGEIIVEDSFGHSDFQALQKRMNLADGTKIQILSANMPVTYVVFDVIEASEYDTGFLVSTPRKPYRERRHILEHMFTNKVLQEPAKLAVSSDNLGWMKNYAKTRDLEGIMAKRLDSRYIPSGRSKSWMKQPFTERIRAVVGGFTEGTGKRAGKFGGLVLGLYDETGALQHIGSVGTGFTDDLLDFWTKILNGIVVDDCPFEVNSLTQRNATWVDPEIVVVVEFRNWTEDLHVRMPAYKGVDLDGIRSKDVTFVSEGVR